MTYRLLQGCYVGISVSESETSSRRGFPPAQVNRATFDIAAALVGQGARVVFGHDWRPDGIMEAVCRIALLTTPEILTGRPEDAHTIENLLPWPPGEEYLEEKDLDRLNAIVRIKQLDLPEGLSEFQRADIGKGPFKDYLRARGLTHLRRALDEHTHARVCFGGKTRNYQGRYPGIFEEAYFTVLSRKPIYLAGSFGGATAELIGAVMGKPMPEALENESHRMREIYRSYADRERGADTSGDRVVNPKVIWSTFQELGLSGLSELNRLSEKENLALFESLVLERTINLILAGVGRLSRASRDRDSRE